MYKTVFRFDTDYRMRLGLFVRYTKLVMVVMCLSVSLSLAVLVTGNGEDIGVLADLQPVEHHQESLHAGPKDGVSAELPPLWQLHSTSQPVLHSTSQAVLHSTSQPVLHSTSQAVLQSSTSTREVADKNDHTVKAVEPVVTTSGPPQVMHHKPGRQDSQTNLFDTADVNSPVLKSLNSQRDADFGNTQSGNTEQSQSVLEVSKTFGESGFMGNQYRHSGDDTGLVKQHSDSSSRPFVQNPVETALDRSLKTEEKSRKNKVDDSTVLDKGILQEFQHQDNPVKYNINENEEDSKSFGNPPILLDMDDQNSEEKPALDLSSDERELQAETADKLDMTATYPNLTLLPMEENFQMLPSEKTRTSGTNTMSSANAPESVKLSDDKESSMLNMINDLIKIESGEDAQNSVGNAEQHFPDSMDGFKVVENKYANKENHGRRVLNEENLMKKASGQADDDYDLQLNIDDYFYQYYDEEEDDYVGGEVLATVSSKAEPAESNGDHAENGVKTEVEMIKDDVVDIDDQKENEELSQDQKGNSGEFNIDRIFSYEADDDDWYYDPEAKERGQLIKTSTTSSIDISLQAKSGMTNASLSESRVGGEVGKAEGVISGEEPHKKVLQGPKGTIILYTAVIVILIACFVLFSVWKNAFPAGRPTHLPTHVRSGEEGKRLLDHPFV